MIDERKKEKKKEVVYMPELYTQREKKEVRKKPRSNFYRKPRKLGRFIRLTPGKERKKKRYQVPHFSAV